MDKAKISATILLLITIAIVLSFNFDVTTVHDADQSILYVNESQTLSPTEQGITSSSLYALNNSYLEFDGVNDYVYLTNQEPLNITTNEDSFTYSAWIKASDIPSQVSSLVSNTYATARGSGLDITNTSGNILARFMTRNDTLSTASISSTSLNINTWYFVVGTYNKDTNNMSLYLNGNYVNSILGAKFSNSTINMQIGGNKILGGTADWFSGSIDEVRIYNRSLEESEITEIYNSGRYKNLSLPSDGLVLYMPFEETTGNIVYDVSGNNNNGVLIYE